MAQRWAIWLSIENDLRFLSHRDTMRALARAAVRARLPLRYSGGFNPRPNLSLVCPRPVGVASRDDLLVMTLEDPLDGETILARLGGAGLPEGMSVLGAAMLPGKGAVQPRRVRYELPLDRRRSNDVAERLAALRVQRVWPVDRPVKGRRRRGEGGRRARRTVDLRPYIETLGLEGDGLQWTQVLDERGGARPGELLRLLGLDERMDLAAVVRVSVDYCLPHEGQQDFRRTAASADKERSHARTNQT